MTVPLGIIEGFYGEPWSWDARADAVAFLGSSGFGAYIYAPKADAFLRRQWREPHPAGTADELARLAAHCKTHTVRFGVGLSPYELYLDFDDAARAALGRKLAFLDAIGIDDLAILFDDMRGDLPDLAARQIEIIDWIAGRTGASRMIVCPSYYSDDPILDRVFGARPADYLETLGAALDPAIEIMWTGERVCSRKIGVAHLTRVAGTLRRKPFLWDNYPVNDGPRMSPFLHLRAFTGRPAEIADLIAAHGINMASQPVLSRIPALTLADLYRAAAYNPAAAFRRAAETVAGADLARLIETDLPLLQDTGRDKLGEDQAAVLRERYTAVDHPAAREIVAWLDGTWRVSADTVLTQ